MANDRDSVRAVYQGYATKKQSLAFIKSLESSLKQSKEINKEMGINNNTKSIKEVISDTRRDIKWIKKKYGVEK